MFATYERIALWANDPGRKGPEVARAWRRVLQAKTQFIGRQSEVRDALRYEGINRQMVPYSVSVSKLWVSYRDEEGFRLMVPADSQLGVVGIAYMEDDKQRHLMAVSAAWGEGEVDPDYSCISEYQFYGLFVEECRRVAKRRK